MQLQLLCFPSVQLGGRGRAAASQRRWMGGSKRPTERKKRWTAGRGREKCMAAHIASDRVTDEGVDTFHSGRSLSTCLHDPSKTPVTLMVKIMEAGNILYLNGIFLWKWPQCRARWLYHKTMPHPFVEKKLFGWKRDIFPSTNVLRTAVGQPCQFFHTKLAPETFRSSSTLKGKLIKFPKAVGSSDVHDCSNGASRLIHASKSSPVKTTCVSMSVSAAVLASVYRCDFSQDMCEVKAE